MRGFLRISVVACALVGALLAAIAMASPPETLHEPSSSVGEQPNLNRAESRSSTRNLLGALVDKSSEFQPLLERLITRGNVAANEAPGLEDPTAAPAPALLPGQLVYARISKRLLEHRIEKRFEGKWPVDETILGTRFVGDADIRGEMEVVLVPSETQAIAEVRFLGTMHSTTRGYNGPAIVHNLSDTPFEARARLVFCDSGLEVIRATSTATTRSTIQRVETHVRLGRRLAQRIAWRRAHEVLAETDRQASQLSVEKINHAVDDRIAASVVKIQAALKAQLPQVPCGDDEHPPRVACRSTAEYVEVSMHRPEASPEELAIQSPSIDDSLDFVARVHRTVLLRAVADLKTYQTLRPLVAELMRASTIPQVLTASAGESNPLPMYWSGDKQWLLVDYTAADVRTEKPLELLND